MSKDKPRENDYAKAMQKHNRTQQLRKAKKKSGVTQSKKKPRKKNWAQESWDDWDDLDFDDIEPVMSKSEKERQRNLEQQISKQVGPVNQGSPATEVQAKQGQQQGFVVEVSSNLARVSVDGKILLCRLSTSLPGTETGFSNKIAVGDEVLVSQKEDPVIEAILPRRSVLARMYRPDKGRSSDLRQIVAANIDLVLIVASWREPNIWPELIDRYLITAQVNALKAALCINKVDLVKNPGELDNFVKAYEHLDLEIIKTSAMHGEGLDKLDALLRNQTSVLAGLSGVGKSSLIRALQPKLDIRVTPVSESKKHRKQGKHTTTQSNLFELENGGRVIDTPGIREFGVAQINQRDLASFYPEFSQPAMNCRYSDCSHIHEEDCGVKTALANNAIHQIRYDNYRKIRCDLPD